MSHPYNALKTDAITKQAIEQVAQPNYALWYAWSFLSVPIIVAIYATVQERGLPPIGSMFTYWLSFVL